MAYIVIFAEYFRVGLFTIGGGLATLPFLYELALRSRWFAGSAIPEFLAISQMLPGAVGINTISQTGFAYRGIPGALIAAAGAVAPSIITIILVSRALRQFKQNTYVQAVFSGIKPAAAGLLASICLGLVLGLVYNPALGPTLLSRVKPKELILLALMFTLVITLKKHPALYILLGAIAGWFLF